jgi:hypothetical protein
VTDLFTKLAVEAQRIEEDAEHSAKGHYNAAARWGSYHLWLGVPSALIAAIAGAAAFQDMPEVAGGLALTSTALTAVLTFLKPSEHAEIHKTSGGMYYALRNRTRLLREIEFAEGIEAKEEAKARLRALATERDELNQSSPTISRRDYELAKRDIDAGRARYRVDEARP